MLTENRKTPSEIVARVQKARNTMQEHTGDACYLQFQWEIYSDEKISVDMDVEGVDGNVKWIVTDLATGKAFDVEIKRDGQWELQCESDVTLDDDLRQWLCEICEQLEAVYR